MEYFHFFGQGFKNRVTGWRMLLWFMWISLLLGSCTSSTSPPDVSHLPVSLHIERLEKDLFSLDSLNCVAKVDSLVKKYPDFFKIYINQLMNFGQINDPQKKYAYNMAAFARRLQPLYDTVQQHFPNLDAQTSELTKAMQYHQYYFPKHTQPPQVVSYISEFGLSAFTYDTTLLAINLDKYLGKNFSIYQTLGFPRYLINRFSSEYMIPDALKVYINAFIPELSQAGRQTLLDIMVREGKKLYYLDKVMPQLSDTLKMGYSQAQLDWCIANEGDIWAYLISQELLYKTNPREYFKYVEEAPTTNGMPPESPGKVATWVGWQIVRKYMEAMPQTTLPQLMRMNNAQEILKRSKYKPK